MGVSPESARAKPAALNWQDPFLLEDQLSGEERLIRDSAAAYGRDKLTPRVIAANRGEVFDREILREMGALGFLGATLPSEYGGAEANYVSYGLIAREIERVDSGYRSAMSVQSALVMHPIFAYGTEAQRVKYLPDLASGDLVGCFGLTEPDHGSDPGSMITRARCEGGDYRISGAKSWITNAPIADVFIIWAKSDAHDGAIKGFILERGMKGLETPRIEGKFSLRASETGMIQMDDVVVPADNILPEVAGLAGPFGCLNRARLASFGARWGPAESCWLAARDYTYESVAIRSPAGGESIGAEETGGYADGNHAGFGRGRYGWGGCLIRGVASAEAISLMKRNNCGKALDIARVARDMHGGNGVSDEYRGDYACDEFRGGEYL